MNDPSPRAHLFRLALLLLLGVVAFLGVKNLMTPASWNYEVWYRAAARGELAGLPAVHGGNESCQSCHEDAYDDVTSYSHETLNCEGCHGPLTKHVRDGEKIAHAREGSNWQCLNCHAASISKSPDFPQYPGNVRRHKQRKDGVLCTKCHDPHDPTV
ncbi:MAG: hypothetical protein ACE5G3_13530 [Gammaproteobacteria bacterium]